eukprot:7163234-Prymnesium_polylepis.1
MGELPNMGVKAAAASGASMLLMEGLSARGAGTMVALPDMAELPNMEALLQQVGAGLSERLWEAATPAILGMIVGEWGSPWGHVGSRGVTWGHVGSRGVTWGHV